MAEAGSQCSLQGMGWSQAKGLSCKDLLCYIAVANASTLLSCLIPGPNGWEKLALQPCREGRLVLVLSGPSD